MNYLRALSRTTRHTWLPASCELRGSMARAKCSHASDVSGVQPSTAKSGVSASRKDRRKEEHPLDISTMTEQQLQRLTKAQLIQLLRMELQEKEARLAAVQASPSVAQQQPVSNQVPVGKPEKYKLWAGLAKPVNPKQMANFEKLEKLYRHQREKGDEGSEKEDQEVDLCNSSKPDFNDECKHLRQQLSGKWNVVKYSMTTKVLGPDWMSVFHVDVRSDKMRWDAVKQQITYGGSCAGLASIISPAEFLYRLMCLFPSLDVPLGVYWTPSSTWLTLLWHKKTGVTVMCSDEDGSVSMAALYPRCILMGNATKQQAASDVLELANIVCRPNLQQP